MGRRECRGERVKRVSGTTITVKLHSDHRQGTYSINQIRRGIVFHGSTWTERSSTQRTDEVLRAGERTGETTEAGAGST